MAPCMYTVRPDTVCEEVCEPDHNPLTDTVCSCLVDGGGGVVNQVECFAKVNEGGDNGGFAFFEIVVDVIPEADEVV